MRPHFRPALIALMAALLALGPAACGQSDDDADKVKQKAQETYEAAKEFALKKHEEIKKQFAQQLDEMNKRYQELRRQAEESSRDTLDDLNEKYQETWAKAQKTLEELKTATGERFDELKAELDRLLEEMEQDYDKAKKRSDQAIKT